MHPIAAGAIVGSVIKRVAQGDCPTEPPHSHETLEDALLEVNRMFQAEQGIREQLAERCGRLEAALIRAAMPIVEWENGIYVYHCVACDEHGKPDQLRHQLNHLSNCYLVDALKEGT